MSGPRLKVVHIRWWHRPLPLVKRAEGGGFDQVGWVWNQRAYLINNLNHGWVAFVEDQTPENLDHWFCNHCGAVVWSAQRDKLKKAEAAQP